MFSKDNSKESKVQTIKRTDGTVDRIAEGRRLYAEQGTKIRCLGAERYEVPSRSMPARRRFVDLGLETCTCRDAQRNGEHCAHIIAATIAASRPRPVRRTGRWQPLTEKQCKQISAALDRMEASGQLL
jgi:hypothetical protein